ncbi:MAG: ribosome silencing factor [bacterium]
MKDITSDKLASVAARILDDKLGKDITILNISNVSVLADYFVICSADTSTQVRALTSYVKENVKKLFERLPNGQEHDLKNRWNLLDYGDVVVHILHKEERETYAIEKFWNHAFKVSEEKWKKDSQEYSDYS